MAGFFLIENLLACAVEINSSCNLTEREHFTPYYDSVEELGRPTCFKCLFLALSKVSPESSE